MENIRWKSGVCFILWDFIFRRFSFICHLNILWSLNLHKNCGLWLESTYSLSYWTVLPFSSCAHVLFIFCVEVYVCALFFLGFMKGVFLGFPFISFCSIIQPVSIGPKLLLVWRSPWEVEDMSLRFQAYCQ